MFENTDREVYLLKFTSSQQSIIFLSLAFSPNICYTTAVPTMLDLRNEISSSSSCNDIDNCRKLNNIIWSCLTTIFACTWLTLHPNISPPTLTQSSDFRERCSHGLKGFMRHRLLPFVVAVLTPEWILAWAMQQWTVANQIVEEGGEGWTRSHGFFVIMGGFHAFTREDTEKSSANHDPGTPWYPLHRKTAVSMIQTDDIMLPLEEEIQDRSKSDALSKVLVLLQTGWFVIQCVARRVAGLPLSELEVLTLAYTIVNVGIYIAWWDKPRNVARPNRVWMPKGLVCQELSSALQQRRLANGNTFDRIIGSLVPGGKGDTGWAGQTGVPTFYSGSPNSGREFLPATFVSCVVGTLFGAVHCIAWSYSFPSLTDQRVWRWSSVAMVSVPVAVLVFGGGSTLIRDLRKRQKTESLPWIISLLLSLFALPIILLTVIVAFVGPILYVAARITTIVLAFRSLAFLPPGALQTIPWTQWIPHI